jgi:hypothetical protein
VNEFLAGLVERATLRAQVLDRRSRSLFEPVTPAVAAPMAVDGAAWAHPGDLDDGSDLAARDEASRALRRELAAGGDPGRRAFRHESSTAVDARPHLGMPAAAAPRRARPAGDAPWPAVFAGARRDENEPGARPGAPLDTMLATALVVPPGSPAPRPAPMLARMPAHGSPRTPGGIAYSSARARTAPPAGSGAAATALPPLATGDVLAGASALLLRSGPRIPAPPASIVRSLEGRGPRSNESVATSPAPVHVTIGRIEVRASAPATDRPPVRRGTPRPRMTLDDYLNGRRGGSR